MGAGRPQIRCRGPFAGGDGGEAHTPSSPDCGTEQGEQLRGTGAEGCRRRERLREKPKHLYPHWGRERSLMLCVCEQWGQHCQSWDSTASPGDSRDMALREPRARFPPRQAGSASPLQLQPLQSPRQRDTATGGGARSQVPAPKISPTACQQSSVISIQKKTNSGLTPGTDKLPGC